jgi:hypothetical protein
MQTDRTALLLTASKSQGHGTCWKLSVIPHRLGCGLHMTTSREAAANTQSREIFSPTSEDYSDINQHKYPNLSAVLRNERKTA